MRENQYGTYHFINLLTNFVVFIFYNGNKGYTTNSSRLVSDERINDLIQCWTNKPGLCLDVPGVLLHVATTCHPGPQS